MLYLVYYWIVNVEESTEACNQYDMENRRGKKIVGMREERGDNVGETNKIL